MTGPEPPTRRSALPGPGDCEKDGVTPSAAGGKPALGRRSYLRSAIAVGLLSGLAAPAAGAAGPSAQRRIAPVDGAATGLGGRRDASGGGTDDPTTDGPMMGANLNGRARLLRDNLDLLDASNTRWVRAFLDVRELNASGTAPEDDPDIVALRRAAVEKDCALIVSLKWDFKANGGDKRPMSVPRPGSNREEELCRCAVRCLRGIGAPVDVVVLGNEPMWETRREDIAVDDPPFVQFVRTVKDHLVRHGDHGDPRYLVGSLNRTHDGVIRTLRFPQFHRRTFELVRNDPDIDGIDLHIHYERLAQAERTLAIARSEVPDGLITVTEFSPAWRYDRHLDAPIGESAAGKRFARDYGIRPGMTPVEYFEYAKRNPRPPAELGAFYRAMPWYNANHVADVADLFDDYDVSVGTIGFLQHPGMRRADWTENWTPFHVNFLYQPALMRTDRGIERTAHPLYIDDYRARTGRRRPRTA